MNRNRWWLLMGCPLVLCACRVFGDEPLPVDPAATHPIPPFKVSPVKPGAAYQRFMILGDFGTTVPNPQTTDEKEYAADQKRVADAMAMRAKSDGLDFMITVGDNFYEAGVTKVDDEMFKSAFVDIYTGPLNVTTYASLGNHDHKGNVQAQIDYAKINKKWIMDAPYYTFTRTLSDNTTIDFFALDTDSMVATKPEEIAKNKTEVEAQIAWLGEKLKASKARWKFVFGHHPLYCHTARDREKERKGLQEKIEKLLVDNKVDAYLCGHDHLLEMLKPVNGVEYVVSGGGAGPKKAYGVTWNDDQALYAATLGGFVLARVSKDELVFEFVRLDGKTQFAHTIEKK